MPNWISKLFSRPNASSESSPAGPEVALQSAAEQQIGHRSQAASAMAQNKFPEAIEQYRAALGQAPDEYDLYCELCLALFLSGEAQQAREVIRQGIARAPEIAQFHYYMGNVCAHLNDIDQAEQSFKEALALQPEFAEAQFNLGSVYYKAGRAHEAAACFKKIDQVHPMFPASLNSLGVIYKEQARLREARQCFEQTIALQAEFADAHNNLGAVLQELSELKGAIISFRRALSLRPDLHEAQFNLGMALKSQHDLRDALAAFEGALAIRENYAEARWAIAQIRIQILADEAQDWAFFEQQSLQELATLDLWCDQYQVDAGDINGYYPLFFLAASDVNCQPVLARYGELCAKIMLRWYEKQTFSKPAASEGSKDNRIRIGIVSSDLHEHPVWNALIKGWYRHLDRSSFEIHSFYLGAKHDVHTEFARSNSDRFTELNAARLHSCVQALVDCEADILLYPAVGGAMLVKLASLRLAPKQVATWGHPEGSGLPTIDYFISAEDFETTHAQEYYTEQLYCLPRLGCSYAALPADEIDVDFGKAGIDFSIPVLLCPGMPYKYTAGNDHILVAIAQELKQCKLIFFTAHPVEYSEKLRTRLEQAFAAAGLDFAQFAMFIPWQDRNTFFALMKRAHVFLDTITYSGFNTAIQAIQCDLPIVAKEGRFLRGRFGSGILRRMGLKELVADTDRGYVDLAVRLAKDGAYRAHIRQLLSERAPALFDDPEASRDLNRILAEIAHKT